MGYWRMLLLLLAVCASPPEQLSAPGTLYIVFRKAKENMGQCKSEEQDFKSYANTIFRCGCCCLSASLSTKTLRENMGQCKSEGQDFKKAKEKTRDSANLRKETLKNRKEARF
jgi:hypothetical protein